MQDQDTSRLISEPAFVKRTARSMAQSRPSARGVTLIEVLVALAFIAVFSAGIVGRPPGASR